MALLVQKPNMTRTRSWRIGRRLLVAAAFALVCAAADVEAGQAPPPLTDCNVLLDAVQGFESLSEVLDALKGDAFAEAYGTFISDIERLDSEGRGLSQRMQRVIRFDCEPYVEELLRWNTLQSELISIGCSGTLPPEKFAECKPRWDGLTAWQVRLEHQRRTAQGRIDVELTSASAFADRARAPLQNANNVLNPDNTEDAFRLYMWWYLKQHGTPPSDSCQAFARMATVLGQRVKDRDIYMDWLVRTLINPNTLLRFLVDPPPWAPLAGKTFGAGGFKSQYVDKLDDNQVRHAAAYLRVGYGLSGGASAVHSFQFDLRKKYIDGLKPEWDDFYLAVAAGFLGFRLRTGLGGLDTSNFGEAIRSSLCR